MEENANKVGRIHPSNPGVIQEFPIPTSPAAPQEIVTGSDGALWFTEFGANPPKIGRITTAGAFTEYTLPAGAGPDGITSGPDGAIWFSESGAPDRIGRIHPASPGTPSSPNITHYPVNVGLNPGDITTGPDGRLWFTMPEGQMVGALDPATGNVQGFDRPGADPSAIASSGASLWFTQFSASKVENISTTGARVTDFTVGAGPSGIAFGPDSALWFTESTANKIGRLTTGGGLTEFPVPTPGAEPDGIVSGPDGALWFTMKAAGKIGRVQTDITPPESSASSPLVSKSNSISVTYSASDGAGTGIKEVELWVQRPTDIGFPGYPGYPGSSPYRLVATDTSPESPGFTYTATEGDGSYRFYTRARDNQGIYEGPPSNSPDSSTLLDTTAPDPVILTATDPASPAGNVFQVRGKAEEGSTVQLYTNPNCSGSPIATGLASTFATPGFSVSVADDSTTILRATATDQATNVSTCSLSSITYVEDSTPPGSAALAPALSTSESITINYSGTDGPGSGIRDVELWVQGPNEIHYRLVATNAAPNNPSFTFHAAAGNGLYRFYTRAHDRAGNYEDAPLSPPDATTVVQSGPPGSCGCVFDSPDYPDTISHHDRAGQGCAQPEVSQSLGPANGAQRRSSHVD